MTMDWPRYAPIHESRPGHRPSPVHACCHQHLRDVSDAAGIDGGEARHRRIRWQPLTCLALSVTFWGTRGFHPGWMLMAAALVLIAFGISKSVCCRRSLSISSERYSPINVNDCRVADIPGLISRQISRAPLFRLTIPE